jgi:aspartyl-tRNA(Asn)/glutamyl-tRNA(Gln) amidotransferase subunit A
LSIDPFSSITDTAKALRSKKVSSVELTQMYLERLKTKGQEHRAVALLLEDYALRRAHEADGSLRSAKSPLHGIPYGVKDLLSFANFPTEWGSPGHKGQTFDHDATVVSRLNAAGGVLVAKLATIELAGGGNYDIAGASSTGAALCAWDKSLWAGGSSSGPGAATGLGCVSYAIGTETSGSITCPSAFNGLTGFRPTYGRVSRYGAMALCWSLDKIGPMARSAEDCAIILEAIAGPDPNDGSTIKQKLNLRTSGPKPRIGLLKEDFAKNKAADCEKAYNETLAVFRKLGYETVDVAYPDLPYGMAIDLIVNAEGASAHEHFIRGENFQKLADVNQIAGFTASLAVPAIDYLWAMRFRTEALKANAVWDKCDCIFTPVFYHKASVADKPLGPQFEFMGGDSGPSNLLGWPAIAFLMGFEEGAPLGGQILAPCMREDVCLQVVRDFQRETDLHRRRPPGA